MYHGLSVPPFVVVCAGHYYVKSVYLGGGMALSVKERTVHCMCDLDAQQRYCWRTFAVALFATEYWYCRQHPDVIKCPWIAQRDDLVQFALENLFVKRHRKVPQDVLLHSPDGAPELDPRDNDFSGGDYDYDGSAAPAMEPVCDRAVGDRLFGMPRPALTSAVSGLFNYVGHLKDSVLCHVYSHPTLNLTIDAIPPLSDVSPDAATLLRALCDALPSRALTAPAEPSLKRKRGSALPPRGAPPAPAHVDKAVADVGDDGTAHRIPLREELAASSPLTQQRFLQWRNSAGWEELQLLRKVSRTSQVLGWLACCAAVSCSIQLGYCVHIVFQMVIPETTLLTVPVLSPSGTDCTLKITAAAFASLASRSTVDAHYDVRFNCLHRMNSFLLQCELLATCARVTWWLPVLVLLGASGGARVPVPASHVWPPAFVDVYRSPNSCNAPSGLALFSQCTLANT